MAESAVTFLLKKLSNLVEEELKLLGGVRGDFVFIRDELESMRAFLRVADAKEDIDPELQAWVKQIRDVANDTDDVVDEFMLHLPPRHRHGFSGSLSKLYHQTTSIKFRHQIASQIQEIKARVIDIAERRQRYNYKLSASDQGSSSNAANNSGYDRRGDALLLEEAELVGIDKPKQQLIDQLLDGDSRLKAISVVGMGGLGKTTLVKRVYEDTRVRREFQSHGWITFSQSFKIEELLKDLIQQLCEEAKQPLPHRLDTMNTNSRKVELKAFLQDRRYVLVLDDVWSRDAWDAIKYALPNSDCGSRVLLTTRIGDVASTSCKESNGYVHDMKALSPAESWTLFCRQIFQREDCPPHLKQVLESILGRCEGLPLAIVAIAGVLASKDQSRLDEWELVNRSLKVEGSDVEKILLLSYNDLPYYLKSCFLYLSGFPEDHLIGWRSMIRVLIAEGFVEEKVGETLEEVAEAYLYELLNRSLIQVAEKFSNGMIYMCRIHDLLREMILSKSRHQNFHMIAGERSMGLPEKTRRLFIHSTLQNIPHDKCFSQLRSLLMFGVDEPLSESSMPMLFTGELRLLRTLNLRGASLETFPGGVVKCFHLTYLNLSGTKVEVLPKSIGKLKNLETLDLGDTHVSELPVEILKLQRLRHLFLHRIENYPSYLPFQCMHGFKAPSKIGGLQFLQSLDLVEVNHVNGSTIVKEIGRLTQLRRLGIGKLRKEDGVALCSSIGKLNNLRTLYVSSVEEDEILDLQSLSPAPRFLQDLDLTGCLGKLPRWITSLHGLTRVVFRWSRLRDVDLLQSLQDLPNLVVLEIGEKAYEGEGLCFNAGGFQKLKELWLIRLKGLRWVKVEEGAMTHLEKLYVTNCELMKELPSGIEHLSNLTELDLHDMSDGLISKLNRGGTQGGEYQKIAHIPKVWIGNSNEGPWKGKYL